MLHLPIQVRGAGVLESISNLYKCFLVIFHTEFPHRSPQPHMNPVVSPIKFLVHGNDPFIS